jgi:S-adenosylmethionine:tRNA ribosyltransferase-isomerase
MTIDFALPPSLQATEPPEERGVPRDQVRLLVSRRAAGEITHHRFTELPGLLVPGDLLVVNNSGTLPAAVTVADIPHPGDCADAGPLAIHFSTELPEGDWLVELRAASGPASKPCGCGEPGERLILRGGAELLLSSRFTARLWRARLSTAVIPYLLRHGRPIRYGYVPGAWPISAYQTVFAGRPGSAEMPSASRPFSPEIVTSLVARGVAVAPVTLHAGVSSLEGDEDPYPEPYDVPPATARLVNLTRRSGGRVIAAGTTVVRALETAARSGGTGGGPDEPGAAGGGPDEPGATGGGPMRPSAGWTSLVVSPEAGLLAVDGLLTGLHEPQSSHLLMLAASAGSDLLARCYAAAVERGYLWHEFGDVHLLLP